MLYKIVHIDEKILRFWIQKVQKNLTKVIQHSNQVQFTMVAHISFQEATQYEFGRNMNLDSLDLDRRHL